MASGILGIIDGECVHIVDMSDWAAHHSVCGIRFKKNKFTTLSFDQANESITCQDCVRWIGGADEDPRYNSAHFIVQNFMGAIHKERQHPIRLFAFKLGRLQRWLKRTAGHRSILKSAPK